MHIKPLTVETWPALEKLFGAKGACGGCWCMYRRITAAGFSANKGEGNRTAFREICAQGLPTGVLAFEGDKPVGRCAIAPREHLIRLKGSRILKPVDTLSVWSVHCFFIQKQYRNKGLSVDLLKAAAAYAASKGATWVEGYPSDIKEGKSPDPFVWTGLYRTFLRAGFTEVARRSKAMPVMRLRVTTEETNVFT